MDEEARALLLLSFKRSVSSSNRSQPVNYPILIGNDDVPKSLEVWLASQQRSDLSRWPAGQRINGLLSTMRCTKPSNRFLKPALDESKVSPACCWYLKWSTGSTVLLATLHYGVWSSILGVAIGAAHSAAFRPARQPMRTASWRRLPRCSPVGSDQCNRRPFASGQMPEWSADRCANISLLWSAGWCMALLWNHQSGLTGRREHVFGAEPAPKCRQFQCGNVL